jgi:hypothetical protein
MVQAAVGAFSLTASTLYLPREGKEVEARNGVHDGDLGGRRGRNHRGRKDRHDASDHKQKRTQKDDERPLPGKGALKNIQLRVMNLSSDPFSVSLISDVVNLPYTVAAHDLLAEANLQDDQGWIWTQNCGCRPDNGVAIFINNPTFGGVWYQVWADMPNPPRLDGLFRDPYTYALTGPTTIAERQEVIIPWPRLGEKGWDLRLRRFDDSATFKQFELEYRGKKQA